MTKQLSLVALVLSASFVWAGAAHGLSADDYSGCAGFVPTRVLNADPSNYQSVLSGVMAGDLVQLAAGTYASGLDLRGVAGTAGSCIVIEGPASGAAAIFAGDPCCNTVSLGDSAYLVVRNLELDGQDAFVDAVKAESPFDFVHHVTLENLTIHGYGVDQQAVGISTKCPAWNLVLRRNTILRAGTGMYLGNSDGEDELAHSLIEYNLIEDSVGYDLQIKHQNGRATGLGSPASGQTIVRHNVFSKASNASGGASARPSLLVGHLPPAGAGSDDDYLIYGNFFWQNETGSEALFQGEGNVIFYDNLLVNNVGPAVLIQPHNDVPKRVRVFHNTIVASGIGIRVDGGDVAFEQRVEANAIFAGTPLELDVDVVANDNVTDSYGQAGAYLVNPDGVVAGGVDRLDLYPLVGVLDGTALNLGHLASYTDFDRDFDGTPRSGTFRGAYAGEGTNPGWQPALEIRPEIEDVRIFADGFESGSVAGWSASVP